MHNLSVGKDVLSFCTKCKLILSAIIIAMKDDKVPFRVECNTCKTTQAFKDPSTRMGVKKTKAKRTRAKEVPVAEIWEEAIKNPNANKVKYTIKGNFIVGDILDHKKFGPGVVFTIIDNHKIEVIFQSQIKHLVYNR